MDRFIAGFDAEPDADLKLCRPQGVAYQADMTVSAAYDEAYYNKCRSYEDQEIAIRINAGRASFVQKFYGHGPLVDIGIGSGEFIKKRPNTYGHDVNPVAIEWLNRNDLRARNLRDFDAFTFWDVIEHVEEPETYFRHVCVGGYVFTSIPIFGDLSDIRKSRHYRPGEHLYYFTELGFVAWMNLHGFMRLDTQDFEVKAGRESILSFAFRRYRWPMA